MLMKQYDAARLDEAKQAAIIQVVEPAIEPDRKSSPKRPLIVLLVALASVLVSFLYVLAGAAMSRMRLVPGTRARLEMLKMHFFNRMD
jgi:uncharacterized protein involved in exopolysaccharide biosynthesis